MFKRILIVVDSRPVAQAAVQQGLKLAQVHEADVVFFTLLPQFPLIIADAAPFVSLSSKEFGEAAKASARRLLDDAKSKAAQAFVLSQLVMGRGDDAAESIVETAAKKRCDLIVVASQGRTAVMRLLTGSVIPGLITATQIPVLVCKGPLRKVGAARAAVRPPKVRSSRKRAAAAPAMM